MLTIKSPFLFLNVDVTLEKKIDRLLNASIESRRLDIPEEDDILPLNTFFQEIYLRKQICFQN